MKKNIFLLLFLSFFWSLSRAQADDPGLTLPAHSGAERSFDSVSRSSVIVVTQFGYGTGTVVKYKKKVYVLTASHVVSPMFGENVEPTIIKEGKTATANVIYRDPNSDVAVLSITSDIDLDAYKISFPRRSVSMGDSVGYCGYPNRRDLSCFTGRVSGFPGEYINIHSFAFSGASGSLVVDSSGHAVGILSAVEVGQFLGIPQALESVVWVVPISKDILEDL